MSLSTHTLFSRLCWLTAISEKSAPTEADTILQWLYVFGILQTIASDQGKEFCNELAEHLYCALQIKHKTTTPYHPQRNASAERSNRTMVNFLRRAILDSENSSLDWELYLGPLMLSYNSGVSKTTRVTPFYATFGIDPNIPLWTSDFSTCEVKSDKVSDQLHNIWKAQSQAHRIIAVSYTHLTLPTNREV